MPSDAQIHQPVRPFAEGIIHTFPVHPDVAGGLHLDERTHALTVAYSSKVGSHNEYVNDESAKTGLECLLLSSRRKESNEIAVGLFLLVFRSP